VKTFIMSFKRFCNTYCIPHSIYSDNAKQFLSSRNHLKDALIVDDFQDHLQRHSIRHQTIPSYASWVGGIYERQIMTVKQCLYKTVGRARLTQFELLTHLSDIQNAVNSRPLTYVHSEINEVEPLSPNKILKLHSNPRLQLVEDTIDHDPLWTPESGRLTTQQELSKTLTKQSKLFEDYKRMWYGMYVLGLRETSKDVFQTSWEDRIKVNDIVLVHAQKPRIFWLMGRVVQLIYSDDGKVRSALLRMPNHQVSRYAVSHLYPLEIQATHPGNRDGQPQSQTVPIAEEEPNEDSELASSFSRPGDGRIGKQPKRQAAINLDKMIKEKINEGLL